MFAVSRFNRVIHWADRRFLLPRPVIKEEETAEKRRRRLARRYIFL